MKYLFLCSMGQNRSPTAARVAKDIARKRGLDIDMFYGGIDNGIEKEKSREELVEWINQYDKIFVMENRMITERLNHLVVDSKKVFCLYIEDIYIREDLELVRILENNLKLFVS